MENLKVDQENQIPNTMDLLKHAYIRSLAKLNQILISHETYALIKEQMTCEKQQDILMKGVTDPVQSYQVVYSHESENEIKFQWKGFSIYTDMDKIPEENRIQAIKVIETALTKIQETAV